MDLIPCLLCGNQFRNLGRHLACTHDMTGDAYRSAFRLPATARLVCPDLYTRLCSYAPDPDKLVRDRLGRRVTDVLERKDKEYVEYDDAVVAPIVKPPRQYVRRSDRLAALRAKLDEGAAALAQKRERQRTEARARMRKFYSNAGATAQPLG